MATIALYANKIKNMPGLIKNVKKSVTNFKSELSKMKNSSLQVNQSVCNLDDVINTISASTKTQEEKISSLESFQKKSEQFITDTARIDSDVAEIVNQRKDDFYNKYEYLKPECEKSGWEKFCDGVKSVGEWCKEHWKLIVTVVIVIAAVVVIVFFPAAAPILLLMAKGVVLGAVVGGVLGGTISALTGGSFWEGFENGAFGGAIAGLISGGMAFTFTGGMAGVSMTFGQTLLTGAVSSAGSSLIGDLGDKFIKGDDISFSEMLLNTAFSAAIGTAFAGAFYGFSKGLTALKLKFSGTDANSGVVEFTTPKNNATPETIAQTKAYVKGCNEALKDGALSSTGRVSTKGQLRIDASKAAAAEKAAAAAAGNPYSGHVGHVPDTTWTGTAQPYSWLDLTPSVNYSLGAQAIKYPIGYQPTKFVFNSPFFNVFNSPAIWSSPFSSTARDFILD